MTLNEYQQAAMKTAVYKQTVHPIQRIDYALMGLGGEAGEALNKRKKWLRGDFAVEGLSSEEAAEQAILQELGDVLWYVAAAADELGTSLENLAAMNLRKLAGRHLSGTLASGAMTEDR